MEQIFTLLLLFIVIGLLERFVRAAKKQQRTQAPHEAQQGEALEGTSGELRDLILEELGLGLERRPKVLELPEPEESSGTVAYPQELEPVAEAARAEPERGRIAARRRKAEVAQRGVRRRRKPGRRRERRPAVSLEQPRRPEDHERFHERYAIPTPVQAHEPFHERYLRTAAAPVQRRTKSPARLPEERHWSAVQKAIVWAEVIGPPKGLTL